jgi:Acetyltransferase (GNAT) domain
MRKGLLDTEVTSPAPRALWQSAAAGDPDVLPTQMPSWTDAVCARGGFTDASRLYRTADDRRLVVPMVRRRATGPYGVEASMPTHWGFGGIIAEGGLAPADVRLVLTDLAARRVLRQGMRANPLHGRVYTENMPRGAVTIARRAHVLDLSGGVDVVWKGMSSSRRKTIRKAERSGVEVECDTTGRLLPEFFDLYARSEARWAEQSHEPLALARFRTRFRDTIEKWQTISRRLDGGCRLWVARHEGRPVASIIVLFGVNVHHTRGAMDKELASPVRANDLLFWHAIQAACAAGAESYHLGESGASGPLSDYKERFGARPYDYPELRLERLPITRADAVARSAVKRVIGFREP